MRILERGSFVILQLLSSIIATILLYFLLHKLPLSIEKGQRFAISSVSFFAAILFMNSYEILEPWQVSTALLFLLVISSYFLSKRSVEQIATSVRFSYLKEKEVLENINGITHTPVEIESTPEEQITISKDLKNATEVMEPQINEEVIENHLENDLQKDVEEEIDEIETIDATTEEEKHEQIKEIDQVEMNGSLIKNEDLDELDELENLIKKRAEEDTSHEDEFDIIEGLNENVDNMITSNKEDFQYNDVELESNHYIQELEALENKDLKDTNINPNESESEKLIREVLDELQIDDDMIEDNHLANKKGNKEELEDQYEESNLFTLKNSPIEMENINEGSSDKEKVEAKSNVGSIERIINEEDDISESEELDLLKQRDSEDKKNTNAPSTKEVKQKKQDKND
jgi:hypothetical protein